MPLQGRRQCFLIIILDASPSGQEGLLACSLSCPQPRTHICSVFANICRKLAKTNRRAHAHTYTHTHTTELLCFYTAYVAAHPSFSGRGEEWWQVRGVLAAVNHKGSSPEAGSASGLSPRSDVTWGVLSLLSGPHVPHQQEHGEPQMFQSCLVFLVAPRPVSILELVPIFEREPDNYSRRKRITARNRRCPTRSTLFPRPAERHA